MTIATDITTANTTNSASLDSIDAQVTILEADHASDPQTFGKSGGPQAAGLILYRMSLLKVRCDKLNYDNR
jgi:hypothetical protein